MEWQGIVASVGTFILGVGVVWTFLSKFTPKAKKYLKIAKESLDLVNSIVESYEDKTLTKDEIEKIAKEAQELKEALK